MILFLQVFTRFLLTALTPTAFVIIYTWFDVSISAFIFFYPVVHSMRSRQQVVHYVYETEPKKRCRDNEKPGET